MNQLSKFIKNYDYAVNPYFNESAFSEACLFFLNGHDIEKVYCQCFWSLDDQSSKDQVKVFVDEEKEKLIKELGYTPTKTKVISSNTDDLSKNVFSMYLVLREGKRKNQSCEFTIEGVTKNIMDSSGLVVDLVNVTERFDRVDSELEDKNKKALYFAKVTRKVFRVFIKSEHGSDIRDEAVKALNDIGVYVPNHLEFCHTPFIGSFELCYFYRKTDSEVLSFISEAVLKERLYEVRGDKL